MNEFRIYIYIFNTFLWQISAARLILGALFISLGVFCQSEFGRMSGKSVIVRPPREIKVWKSACGLSLSRAQMLSHGIGSLSLAASRCSFERGVGKGQRGVGSTMWINIYKLKTHTHTLERMCFFVFDRRYFVFGKATPWFSLLRPLHLASRGEREMHEN